MASILDRYGQAYKAAEFNRLTSHLPATSRPSREELAWGTIRTLRARSRYIARNHAHAAGAIRHIIRRTAANMRIQERLRDAAGGFLREENTALSQLRKQWSRGGITTTGMRESVAYCLAVWHRLVDGEAIWIKTENPSRPGVTREWQMIRSDQVAEDRDKTTLDKVTPGNDVIHGVEINPSGRPVAYHIYTDGFAWLNGSIVERIEADRVLHWFMPEHADATRGLPILTPVILKLADLDEFFAATLTQAWAQASVVAFVKTMMAAERMETMQTRVGVVNENTNYEPSRWNKEMVPGTMEFLEPGEDITFADPKSPSGNIDPFSRVILRAVAAGLGISYEALARDYTQTNYSSGRQTEQQDKITYREINQQMDEAITDPVNDDFVDHVYMINRLRPMPAAADIYARFIHHPQPGFVDPNKETDAALSMIAGRIESPQAICAERGRDFYEVIDEIAEAEAYMKSRNVELLQMVKAAAARPEPQDTEERPAARAMLAGRNGTAHP